jgi:hypothetical protein
VADLLDPGEAVPDGVTVYRKSYVGALMSSGNAWVTCGGNHLSKLGSLPTTLLTCDFVTDEVTESDAVFEIVREDEAELR